MQGADMRDYSGLPVELDIPGSVYDTIIRQHSSDTDCNTALLEWYFHNHPAPSWRHVADALYREAEHTVLAGLKDQIPSLKGEVIIQDF